MVNRGGKNIFRKIFYNPKFISLIGLAAIILLSLPLLKNSLKRYRVNKEISELKQEIERLQSKNSDLKNFVSYLGSEQFAEEQARLNLNLKKAGEELMVIKSGAGAQEASASGSPIFNIPGYNQAQAAADTPNPRKWLDYFFSNN